MDLTPELMLQIFEFVDPPTLIDLACSSKYLEQCSRGLLRKHRELHDRYRLVADVNPRSLPDVLKKAMLDPSLAWHIRDLEFTCARTNWSHWEESELGGPDGSKSTDPPLPPEYAFTQDEQVGLLDQLREAFHFEEQHIDKAREDLQHGNDAPLKLVLIGVCPKLRCLKFSRNFHLSGRSDLEQEPSDSLYDKPRSSLQYFHQAIIIQLKNRSSVWPVGLASLQDLSIGVNQDLAIGADTGAETEGLTFAPSPYLFTDLKQLPHLVSLYCCGLEYDDYDSDDEGNVVAHRKTDEVSSSLQHLFVSGAHGIGVTHARAVVSGCKQLRSFTMASSDMDDIDCLVQKLGELNGKSLETLMFYETAKLHGYRRFLFETEDLGQTRNLRMVYVDAGDMDHDSSFNHEKSNEECQDHEQICYLDYYVAFFMYSLPENTEVLVLGSVGPSFLSEDEANNIDHAITKMIERGRGDDTDDIEVRTFLGGRISANSYSFPNLKAIYLGALDDRIYADRFQRVTHPRCKRWFSKAIAAGRKYGIDVHTRTTRSRPFHQIDFPKPPRMESLKVAALPPEQALAFDVYTGRWGPADCRNCGACAKCLRQYDASVWKEIGEDGEQEHAQFVACA